MIGMEGNVMSKEMYDGMLGLVVGDALGVPVEFSTREDMVENPVIGMREYGTHDQPMGTWSDDSSLALATLASLREKGYDPNDMMERFANWRFHGAYSPFGEVFDCGVSTDTAIRRYTKEGDVTSCGCFHSDDNGNGSLMRILPACIYFVGEVREGRMKENKAVYLIHQVSGLTHNHPRSRAACGIYYFLVKAIIEGRDKSLRACLKEGCQQAFDFYAADLRSWKEGEECEMHYQRLFDLDMFSTMPDEEISSSGYVVSTLEAAVWCLLNTDSYETCLLKAVNLGHDTDTVGAVAGGLAGLYYTADQIPEDWKNVIQMKDWIRGLCLEK